MFRSKSLLAAAVGALLAVPLTATAGTIVVEVPGSGKVTTGLTGFVTFGDDMDGMLITATFSGGGKETKVWGDTGPGSGGAFGTGWSLTQSGDTFGGPWTLSNAAGGPAIVSLLIDGVPGKTVFDDGAPSAGGGTPGSAGGLVFAPLGGTDGPFDILTTYFDILSVGKAAPVGDVYTKVKIEFTNGKHFTGGSTLRFEMDADNAVTEIRDVPEPATCTLLGIGFASAVGYRVRRRKA